MTEGYGGEEKKGGEVARCPHLFLKLVASVCPVGPLLVCYGPCANEIDRRVAIASNRRPSLACIAIELETDDWLSDG